MQPALSIVIPTYNSEAFIRETISSVARQTSAEFEVVVVDDASTDSTCSIVEYLASAASFPLRLIRLDQNSGGPVRPMNVGVESARGELFTILDHDDLLSDDAVERYLSAWRELGPSMPGMLTSDLLSFRGEHIIYRSHFRCPSGLAELMPDVGSFETRLIPAKRARGLLCRSMCLPAKAAYPKGVWEQLGGFDKRYRSAWDAAFVWEVTRHHAVAVIDRVLVHVRQVAGSLSARPNLVAAELATLYKRMSVEIDSPELRRAVCLRRERELFDELHGAYRSWRAGLFVVRGLQFLFSRARRGIEGSSTTAGF